MILYNVTVKIELDTHDEWLAWMVDVHIPDVMETQCFTDYRMCRLRGVDESDGITYAIQYESPSEKVFTDYSIQHAPRLQKEHKERYNGKYVAFRTIMEIVSKSGN